MPLPPLPSSSRRHEAHAETLKGDAFPVEVEGSTKVLAVKEMAANSESGKAAGWEVAGIKLIFQGKVLDDSKDLASYNINENDFMVIMASKPKKPASAPAPAAAAPAAAAPVAAAPAAAAPAAPAAVSGVARRRPPPHPRHASSLRGAAGDRQPRRDGLPQGECGVGDDRRVHEPGPRGAVPGGGDPGYGRRR